MARRNFHALRTDTGWRHGFNLHRNPFVFAITLASISVMLTVFLAAGSATASEAPGMAELEIDRGHSVALIAALQAGDPQLRLRAVHELAWRRTTEAAEALINVTYDADARVREEAVVALGEIGALKALPRLQELQIVQGNERLQQAAFQAERQLTNQIARGLAVPRSQVQAFTYSPAGEVYAVAHDMLYVQSEEAWKRVGLVPDHPVALVVTTDNQFIFAATAEAGLYRSPDYGKTWTHIQFGKRTAMRLNVTALAADPYDARYLYVALASRSGEGGEQTPHGIAASEDGGATWVMLPDAPAWAVTTRLIRDATAPGYLFGEANGEAWRYALIGWTES